MSIGDGWDWIYALVLIVFLLAAVLGALGWV